MFASAFDVRTLLRTIYYLNDEKSLAEIDTPWITAQLEKWGLKKLKGSYIEQLLAEAKLV